jgi:hypothetical protein
MRSRSPLIVGYFVPMSDNVLTESPEEIFLRFEKAAIALEWSEKLN